VAGKERWMLCACLGERYAIHLRWAQEILYRPQLLPLPGLDAALAGLIIWRGQTLPVIGLRLLSGAADAAPQPAAVMLDANGRRAGLLVDDIGETVELAPDALFALGPVLTSGRPYLAQGAMHEGLLLFIIDAPALLQRLRDKAGQAVPGQPATAA
jgi:purine-binding chemotaxis protein CheW